MSDERDRNWQSDEPEQEKPDVEAHRLYENDEGEEGDEPDVEAHRLYRPADGI